jgi:hypothetical protein
MGDENKVRDAADAIKGIAEAIPLYQDALQPAVREVGVGLHTLSKTVHIALAPVKALVWGWDKIESFVTDTVARKLEGVPAERVVPPQPHVVVPALESLRYLGEEPQLRDLFANLLAASLDGLTTAKAHPGFVEIIKNMSPDEARLLKVFASRGLLPAVSLRASLSPQETTYKILARRVVLVAEAAGCTSPSQESSYLDNLSRLGLIEEIGGFGDLSGPTLSDKTLYEPLEKSEYVRELRIETEKRGATLIVSQGVIRLTDLGHQFCAVCILEHATLVQQR